MNKDRDKAITDAFESGTKIKDIARVTGLTQERVKEIIRKSRQDLLPIDQKRSAAAREASKRVAEHYGRICSKCGKRFMFYGYSDEREDKCQRCIWSMRRERERGANRKRTISALRSALDAARKDGQA